MKVNRTWATVGLLGALGCAACGQSTNLDLTTNASKTQIQPVYPTVEYKLEIAGKAGKETPEKIVRFGDGSSSQAWTTIATRRENPTAFHDASTHEPQFVVCSLGHQPAR